MISASRGERLLLVATPAVAMAAVALGLRLGATKTLIAAEVWGAPPSGAGTGLAWQIVVFREENGMREPASDVALDGVARVGDASAHWHGVTNEDGVAEALFALPTAERAWVDLRAGRIILAKGECEPEPQPPSEPPTPVSGWLSFARREGTIALDVAVLGHRVAPGFLAELWVRATDATTHSPLGGVALELANDSSLVRAPPGAAPTETDSRGWGALSATPVGLAVTTTIRARARDARAGEWNGGLYMSPGAARIETRRRWEPTEAPEFDIVTPTTRSTAYFEIDDPHGRAWAAAPALAAQRDGTSSARVRAPLLAQGLYWAVASNDPVGAAGLAAGTIARPFFIASTSDAALAFGTDREACASPRDPREISNALSSCLALSATTPVPRWRALDGFVHAHAVDRQTRANGLGIALGAIVAAMLLEALLLLRAAASAGARVVGAASQWRTSALARVAVTILVALLGFALLAASIVRAGGE